MKHVTNEVTKLVNKWAKEDYGWSIELVECKMGKESLEDFISDGYTEEKYNEHLANYAIFYFDVYCEADSEYLGFDYDRLIQDKINEIKEVLDDVEIKYYSDCHEFEVIREKV